MRKDSFQSFKNLLKKSKKLAIVTHWSPDGDAMGSSLGLYLFLKKLDKKVSVIVPNDYPEFLQWLPGNRHVINYSTDSEKATKAIGAADVIFTLDFNSFKRLEGLGDVLAKANGAKVLIDHHQQPDDYATLYFHDVKACSTCELIYDLIEGLGQKKLIDKQIASCLYTGLMTDTGSFRYSNVSSKTHQILAELFKTGISATDIYSAVYDTYSEERMKLLGYALSEKMQVIQGWPVAYISLTDKELKRFRYKKGDTEGLVNYPFQIKGIKVCVLFSEAIAEGHVKISFRSKGNIDMNQFAREHFNVGGHVNAAGGKSSDTLDNTIRKFVTLVPALFK